MKNLLTLFLSAFISSASFSQDASMVEDHWKLAEQYLDQQTDKSFIFISGMGGQVRILHGSGYADRAKQVPFSDQTLMTIGSITKSFTATAILLLTDQGKLTVQDSIGAYFDQVPADKEGITIHQLLTHSSGLPAAIGDDYESISDEAFRQRAWEQPLLFTPGSSYEYSNVGYSLLGMIIEKVSGQSYSSFLAEHIFTPAGMKTAGYKNPEADYKLLAHGYRPDGTDWGTSHDKNWNGPEPYWHLKANGGLLICARDMYHWYLALRGNIILTPSLLKLQTTPYADEGGESYYGYGYAVDQMGECVQHNGGNGIFKADFRWFPKADAFLFSATNDANTRLFRMNDEIVRILMTGELPVHDEWKEISPDSFPANEDQYTAQAFIDMIHSYSREKGEVFIQEYCGTEMTERNGRERLHELFNRLHGDVQVDADEAYYVSKQKIQIVTAAREENARIKITLTMGDHKITGLQAEIEGL